MFACKYADICDDRVYIIQGLQFSIGEEKFIVGCESRPHNLIDFNLWLFSLLLDLFLLFLIIAFLFFIRFPLFFIFITVLVFPFIFVFILTSFFYLLVIN